MKTSSHVHTQFGHESAQCFLSSIMEAITANWIFTLIVFIIIIIGFLLLKYSGFFVTMKLKDEAKTIRLTARWAHNTSPAVAIAVHMRTAKSPGQCGSHEQLSRTTVPRRVIWMCASARLKPYHVYGVACVQLTFSFPRHNLKSILFVLLTKDQSDLTICYFSFALIRVIREQIKYPQWFN